MNGTFVEGCPECDRQKVLASKPCSPKDRLAARMEGAKAALEGRKLGANPYRETSDLHFEWLSGWAVAKKKNLKEQEPAT